MNDGSLWITSDIGGISILDLHSITFKNPESVQFYNITADNNRNGVSSGNIRNLLQDSFGNIWIGNYSSGVDFISHTQPVFHVLPYMTEKGNILKHKPVWGICKDENNQVWLGGENEISLFKNDKLLKSINISKQLSRPYGQVFSIINAGNGTLLLGIYDDGLLKLDTRSERIERIPLDMENVDIITFFKDTDGTIWIGAEYGIYTYANGQLNKESQLNALLPDKSVYGILRDRQGKLWIGTYGGGIAIFDRNNKSVTLKIPPIPKRSNHTVINKDWKILLCALSRKTQWGISGSVPTMAFLAGTNRNRASTVTTTGTAYLWETS